MLRKCIEIVYPEVSKKQFEGKMFRSYSKLVEVLKPEQCVTVCVQP